MRANWDSMCGGTKGKKGCLGRRASSRDVSHNASRCGYKRNSFKFIYYVKCLIVKLSEDFSDSSRGPVLVLLHLPTPQEEQSKYTRQAAGDNDLDEPG